MINRRAASTIATLLLLGAAGCADLDITNPNDPDRTQALATAGDVESLIAGAFKTWIDGTYSTSGTGLWMSNAAFAHTAMAANFAQLQYGNLPRVPILNNQTDPDYVNISHAWYRNYRALSSVSQGLRALDASAPLRDQLGAADLRRARAYGRFMQGVAHGTLALLYDRGPTVDERHDVVAGESGEIVGYAALMDAAIGYLDDAIALSTGQNFVIPASWTTREITAAELVRISHSLKARYRAAVARSPEERAAVDWGAVLGDIQAGLDHRANERWAINYSHIFFTFVIDPSLRYMGFPNAWQQMNYMVLGMADQSGRYQDWLRIPVSARRPRFADGDWFLIRTPDRRFPQGATIAEQQANSGTMWRINAQYGGQHTLPERGTWRWSMYFNPGLSSALQEQPEIRPEEMRLLAAEAHFRLNNRAAAAELINVSRQAAGLSATDADGRNSSCVPKLPSGECGDLLEMLKWEKRLATWGAGFFQSAWFFDSRGWGDLYAGTPLHLPIPAEEIVTLRVDGGQTYTFGGVGGPGAAPGSGYCWPGEPGRSTDCLGPGRR